MRDPKRINRVIELLRAYWHTNPDLRLGQIIANMTPLRFRQGQTNPSFNVEDTEWEDIFREELHKMAKERK